MEMFEPSESERPKPEDLEEDIARLLGGTSQYGQTKYEDVDTDSLFQAG